MMTGCATREHIPFSRFGGHRAPLERRMGGFPIPDPRSRPHAPVKPSDELEAQRREAGTEPRAEISDFEHGEYPPFALPDWQMAGARVRTGQSVRDTP